MYSLSTQNTHRKYKMKKCTTTLADFNTKEAAGNKNQSWNINAHFKYLIWGELWQSDGRSREEWTNKEKDQ